MKLDELKIGEAIIKKYKDNYKIIIRKEYGDKYYLAHPKTLEKYCFNKTGTFIFIQILDNKNSEEIIEAIEKEFKVTNMLALKWLNDFKGYLKSIVFI